MFDPTKYTVATAKPMPVFLMLDVSGSMDEVLDPENCRSTGETVYKDGQMWNIVEGGTTKLAVLNKAIPEMIKTPVVRNGKQATVGYCPDVWKNWE